MSICLPRFGPNSILRDFPHCVQVQPPKRNDGATISRISRRRSTSTPPDCFNTADPEPSLLFDHNGGEDRSQQRNHIAAAETTSFDECTRGGDQDESIKIYPFSSKTFAEKYPEPLFDKHLQEHLLKLEPQVRADFTVVSLTTPSGGKLYQAVCSLHGVSGCQATRTCDASENFTTEQDARRDAARNALMRLESSPDRAFATAWTGNCCSEGRTALGTMTSPRKLGQSREEEYFEFAAERENRCALDDCPLPPYRDAQGQTHACCSKSHERLRQTGWTRTRTNKCAIPECNQTAHKDETGFTHPCCSKSHANDLHIRLDPARQHSSDPQEITAERFDNMVMSASHCPTKENVNKARDRLDREGLFYAVVDGSYPGVYQGKHLAAAACYPVSNKWTVYSTLEDARQHVEKCQRLIKMLFEDASLTVFARSSQSVNWLVLC